MKEVKMRMRRMEDWRLPGCCMQMTRFFCGESEETLRAMVGRFIEVCR